MKLIAITRGATGLDAESLIVYCARVSSSKQDTERPEQLLKYLISHGHWSPFETVSMTLEIKTSRAISAQILRHRSFSFQEFSQRYASVFEPPVRYAARRQDTKNRQNSIDDLPESTQDWWTNAQIEVAANCADLYTEALSRGIAKECARMVLPMASATTLYMTGSARSWIHYLQARTAPETQKEHRDIAEGCRRVFMEQFPLTSNALGWL